MAARQENLSGFNGHELGFKIPNISGEGTGNANDLSHNDKLTPWSLVENAQLLSAEKRPSELPGGEGRVPATSELQSTSKGPLGFFRYGQKSVGASVKQEKVDYCSPDLAPAEGYNKFLSKCSVSEPKVDPAHAKRANWDLNIATDTWDGSLQGSVVEHGGHGRLDLGGMHKKKTESRPVHMLSGEFKETDVKLGKCHEVAHNLRLSNVSILANTCCDSDVVLDLQLKPPSGPKIHFDWGDSSFEGSNSVRKLTDLSLSMAGSLKVLACSAIKPEPYEEGCQKDIRKIEWNSLKSVDLRHVKSESCEGTFNEEASKTAGFNVKSSRIGEVKLVPHEDPRQACFKRLDGKSFQMALDNCRITSYPADVPKDTRERMALDLNSEPVIYDGSMLRDGREMPIDANNHLYVGEIRGESVDTVSQAHIPVANNSQDSREMPSGSSVPQHANGIISETSELVSDSLISRGKELSSPEEASESGGMASYLLPESVVFDGNEPVAAGDISAVIPQEGCSDRDDSNSLKSVADELHMYSHGFSKITESGEEKIAVSTEIIEQESFDKKHVSERGGVDDYRGGVDYYEDGEVRDSVGLDAAVEGSVEQGEEKQVDDKESASVTGPADVPITMPSPEDVKKKQTQSSDELKSSLSSIGCEGDLCINKSDPGIGTPSSLHKSLAVGVPTAGLGQNRFVKSTHKPKRNHLVTDRGSETESKFIRRGRGRPIPQGTVGELGRQQNPIESGLLPVKHAVLSKVDSSSTGDAIKHGNGRGNHSIKLNSAPNRLWSRKKIGVPARSMVSRIERNMLTERPLRRDKPYHLRARDENCKDRLRKSESGRSEGKPAGKCGSDLTLAGRVENRFVAMQCDRNSDPKYIAGLGDNSTGIRFSMPENISGVDSAVASNDHFGTAGRVARKPMVHEPQQFTQFQFRRWTSRTREGEIAPGIRTAGRSIRDISPSRCTEREVPDFLGTREEKFMRAFPDAMVDLSMLTHPRPEYERVESSPIWKERRSLSPIQRRGPPTHLAHIGMKSSRGSRTRLPHQWSPYRRSPDAFDGRPDHCRSPLRFDRVGSPCQRPCFTGDSVVRRRGSPPCITGLPDGGRDIGPLREPGFPKPGWDLQRNIYAAEEEYFVHMNNNRSCELAAGAEYTDNRSYDERRGPVRPFRQHPSNGGNEGSLSRRVENAPPRPSKFCLGVDEEFPDRGCPGNLDGRIRNRPGNSPSRPKGMVEQEENYRYHGGKGWHDSDFNNGRLKRRRF